MRIKKVALQLAGIVAGLTLLSSAQADQHKIIDVHRDANCGCCTEWMAHMEDNGFTIRDHVETDMISVKQRLGVTPQLASCHTAVIDGKFIEGHVPAKDVAELMERDDLIGLAVPGMPMGSPGMEMGDRKDAYQVIGLSKDGEKQVIAEYPQK